MPPTDLPKKSCKISAFGEDVNGEIYLADYKGGTIYRVTSQ